MLRRLVALWESFGARQPTQPLDLRVPCVLVLAALVLVFEEYVGDRDFFQRLFYAHEAHPDYELWSYWWWAGSKVIGYGLVPLLAMTLARVPLRDALLGVGTLRRHFVIYGGLYVAIVPIILITSYSPRFQLTYPFYRQATRSLRDLVAWELAYAASFVALELFFRGVLVGLLRRTLGAYAIFVAVIPYCMVHFGKPPAETVAAIGAGIVLGTLALLTGSIWGGVALHIGVAWTMDALALLRS